METSGHVYRNRGPEAIAVYGDGLAVYQPGDIIPDLVYKANDGHEWSALGGYIRRNLIKREKLKLPDSVKPDEVDGIVAQVTAASDSLSRGSRRAKTELGTEGPSDDVNTAALRGKIEAA